MTDANSNNSFNPDELASKLIQELSALGVQTNPDVELMILQKFTKREII